MRGERDWDIYSFIHSTEGCSSSQIALSSSYRSCRGLAIDENVRTKEGKSGLQEIS